MKIYTSITTTKKANWKSQIEGINEAGLKEVCFFPTMADIDERKEIYKLLKRSVIEKIPFVHLKSDMTVDELDYLVDNYKTEVFNIHGSRGKFPLENNLDKYANIIYLETEYIHQSSDDLAKYAGICLDVSHLADMRLLRPNMYFYNCGLMKKHKVGCGHISALNLKLRFYLGGLNNWGLTRSHHLFTKLSDFNYLKKYQKHFPEILALELENSISDQLKAKKYIEEILNIDKSG